jgi:hypothetical protein
MPALVAVKKPSKTKTMPVFLALRAPLCLTRWRVRRVRQEGDVISARLPKKMGPAEARPEELTIMEGCRPMKGRQHPHLISARTRAHNASLGSIIFRYPHLVRGWPRQGRPAPLFQASTPRPRGHLSRDVGTGPKMRGSIMQRLHYEADTKPTGESAGSSDASGRGTGKAPGIGEPALITLQRLYWIAHIVRFLWLAILPLSRVGGNNEAAT